MFKNLQKMSTDFPDWYQAELNSNADDTSVRQTIAKPNVIGSTDWDVWLSLVEGRLKKLGYRRYSQNLKSEDFAYWKSFYDEDAKIYQIGLFFYDFRKYADRDPMANRISIQYECMLLGRDRVDMSVSKDIDLPEFEKMARTFYEAMWQYCL